MAWGLLTFLLPRPVTQSHDLMGVRAGEQGWRCDANLLRKDSHWKFIERG